MSKGYWIAHVDVDDPEAYQKYREANGPALAAYGGRFLVRAGTQEVREGRVRSRTVVIEFDGYEKALACYDSEDYQKAIALRANVSTGDLSIVEGYNG